MGQYQSHHPSKVRYTSHPTNLFHICIFHCLRRKCHGHHIQCHFHQQGISFWQHRSRWPAQVPTVRTGHRCTHLGKGTHLDDKNHCFHKLYRRNPVKIHMHHRRTMVHINICPSNRHHDCCTNGGTSRQYHTHRLRIQVHRNTVHENTYHDHCKVGFDHRYPDTGQSRCMQDR